jgi:SAM-dependent methyltransferase
MSSVPASEPRVGDALGLALLDYLEHGSEARSHFIERDDGLLETVDTGVMFTDESDWTVVEAPVGDRAGRRVLDVGAGAGRHALPLQESGRQVVALDISPGAVEVCQRRGVRETFIGTVFDLAETDPEPFDTFLLAGNNYGLLENREHGLRFLAALAEMAVPGAEIMGTCVDPSDTEDPLHLAYHERNRNRGRHPGQIRLRARWGDMATSWFDYLFLPVGELEELAERAGWELVEYQPGSRPYLAVLRLARDLGHGWSRLPAIIRVDG